MKLTTKYVDLQKQQLGRIVLFILDLSHSFDYITVAKSLFKTIPTLTIKHTWDFVTGKLALTFAFPLKVIKY